MSLRAAIFDLYGTLLEVGPPPADAGARWAVACQVALGTAPPLSLAQFDNECRRVVAVEHATARMRGIEFPEVYWPDIVDTVLRGFDPRPAAARTPSPIYRADFLHTVRLRPDAADVLRAAQKTSLLLGLASNCQPYSVHELDTALAGVGLSRDRFTSNLCFFSFAHGFSKPDPHVFRLLTARLRSFGIAPGEALIVGDRADNDLEPARAHGWQTFRIELESPDCWSRLRARLLHH